MRGTMKLKLEKFKEFIEFEAKPRWENQGEEWTLRPGGGEMYIQSDVLKKAGPHLTPENIQSDIRDSLINALNSHVNLLNRFEYSFARKFIETIDENMLREKFSFLLYDDQIPLRERLTDTLAWAKVTETAEKGKKAGINATVFSYILAMTNPKEFPFCKPVAYNAVVDTLLGKDKRCSDQIERIIHCQAIYKELLHVLENECGLVDGNLLDIHSLGYLLSHSIKKPQGGVVRPKPPKIDSTFVYEKAKELKHLFIDDAKFERILTVLETKQNVVLQGPPGVGKTFVARHIAYALMGAVDKERVAMVQFHQSYSYEDFIQGFRPNGDGKFDLKNGVFYDFCHKARQDSTKPHIFIIDEINRGNLSKIFGEMFMLVERDKRGPDFAMPLTYSQSLDDTFYIPENVFIIGTMNTADRSLAMVDYALRRRFAFITLSPGFENEKFRKHLIDHNVDSAIADRLIDRMVQLNEEIATNHKNLGRGYCVGHSYFCPTGNNGNYDQNWYENVIRMEIEPLLEEYWFDDPDKVQKRVESLLA